MSRESEAINVGPARAYDSVQTGQVRTESIMGTRSLPWKSKGIDGASKMQAAQSLIQTRRMGIHLGLGIMDWNPALVFSFNFMAILPLAMILGKATEDIASHTNETVGGLLNATFGNAVELILSINALRAGLTDVIKATLVGSILSNLLLVLGMSLLFGGFVFAEQKVNPVVSEANAGLLGMAAMGFMIPTAYTQTMSERERTNHLEEKVSLVIAVVMLILYILYLTFQLFTHADLYNGVDEEEEEEVVGGEEVPSFTTAMGVLTVSVLLVAVNSDYLVDSVDGFSKKLNLGPTFVSLMLLPLVGNAAEHMSAVTVAMKDKLDLSIGIACGSSVQIAVFVSPLMVILSWLYGGVHLTLDFHILETVSVFLSVFVVNTMLRDFTTNWLEGALLVAGYFMLGGAVWFRVE